MFGMDQLFLKHFKLLSQNHFIIRAKRKDLGLFCQTESIGCRFFLKFFQNRMEIGPAKSKGAHAASPGRIVFPFKPGPVLCIEIERTSGKINLCIGLFNPHGGRQHLMLECHDTFDDAGQTGGHF